MIHDWVGFTAVLGLFVVLPSLIVLGVLGEKWLKLKTAEVDLRRQELELERKKLEYLTVESQHKLVDRLEKEP